MVLILNQSNRILNFRFLASMFLLSTYLFNINPQNRRLKILWIIPREKQ